MRMKKLITLMLALAGMVGTVSATDYSIAGRENDNWVSKGVMTNNGDGTYSGIIDLPANYTNYWFIVFEGTTLDGDWANAYQPYTNAEWNVIGDDGNQYDPTLVKHNSYYNETQITNGYISFKVGANNCYAIKVTFNPSTGACVINKLVAVSSAYNSWANTDYLVETGKNTKIYSGDVPLYASDNTGGFRIVSIENSSTVARGYKNDNGEWLSNDNDGVVNGTVAVDGIYSLTANYNTYAWQVPTLTKVPVTVSNTYGWATCVTTNAVDFSEVTGLKAYTATVSGNTVTLNEAGEVPAGTALVLKATAANTYNVPVVESASAVTNDLQGSASTSKTINSGDKIYALVVDDSGNAQFTLMNAGELAAGKAYLDLTSSGARELRVVFADEATGINASVVKSETVSKGVYDLQGRRVASPTKGLYIVNGKKVIY